MTDSSGVNDKVLRPEIAASWRRSEIAGLTHEIVLERLQIGDFESSSQLLTAAVPVLDGVARDLTGLTYSLLLADADCRIVGRWFDRPTIDTTLQRAGAVTGSRWKESDVGTNGLGTPAEVRSGMWVHGAEHFAAVLSGFTCYGLPILHPLTRRVEGVLNITVHPDDAHPLFPPTLTRVVDDIEQRLIDTSRPADSRLFRAFREACRTGRAIVALNDHLMLASNAAVAMAEDLDLETMREIARSAAHRGTSTVESLLLLSGAMVTARIDRLHDLSHGAVFWLRPRSGPHAAPGAQPANRSHLVSAERATSTAVASVFVEGEPGSGRSTVARSLLDGTSVTVIDALDCLVEDSTDWAGRLAGVIDGGAGGLVIDNVHVLPGQLVDLLARTLSVDHHSMPIVLAGNPQAWLPAHVQPLVRRCRQVVALKPLRERRNEFPVLAQSVIDALEPGRTRRLAPSAVRVLTAQPWPGNIPELREVLRHALANRPFGALEVVDLPAAYRVRPVPALAGRENAERHAIIEALRRFDGNKTRAAQFLGITRTTLYNRLRALKITDDTVHFLHS
ncbi:sigma-54-dependent Fis family transcriptional regulator [Rhodococcus sp. JVH1]|uniref:sigma-54-dependent Fis family transcriptional regulator n=1 Tax=Rhodococcus sp. JVH1 TaxID=745408 RepID=UPI000271F92E|nr:helix-turn-helix domain-containing protein [Rhodococcus sp. JVH1]EJI97913.1 bacterial regulatory protein, Fis family protein [Rhodococcus sp. JVH1]